MSYRDPTQALKPSINKILSGIDEFNIAAENRAKDLGEWKKDHLIELIDLRKRMLDLAFELRELESNTW